MLEIQTIKNGFGADIINVDLKTLSEQEFERIKNNARQELVTCANETCATTAQILQQYRPAILALTAFDSNKHQELVAEVNTQLEGLVYPGFLSVTPYQWLPHLQRFLQAIEIRLQRARHQFQKDRNKANEIAPYRQRYQDYILSQRGDKETDPEAENYRWMLEELTVSIFAQEFGTSIPVSFKRLDKQWQNVQV